ncbi:MAG TPA: biotin/lipoate A/B protein ligase family protein, partial [bacterium]|nr:biotin/lipoate A/B protein ligase family protein [bacterium]
PLRSQSIYHGVTESMLADSDVAISIMRPARPYVSVGYFQETEREVDLAYCESRRMPVYRRHVGGGAVLLDGDQLFFHVMVPVARAREFGLPERLAERFAYLARPPILAYRRLGVEAVFRPVNDIQVRGKKIGGTGVGEIGDGIVFAGSMMLDFDTELMTKVLRIADEKMRDKVFQGLDQYMTTLAKELGAKPEVAAVAEALVAAFEEAFGLDLVPAALTPDELAAVERWDAVLTDPEWLHQVRLKGQDRRAVKISESIRVLQAERKAPGGMLRLTLRTVDGRIAELLLSGDFPASPQGALDGFSQAFLDAPLERAELNARLHAALAAHPLDLAGVEESDLNLLMEQVTR